MDKETRNLRVICNWRNIDAAKLTSLLSKFGLIFKIRITSNFFKPKSVPFSAIVTFEQINSAINAKNTGIMLDDSVLKLSFCSIDNELISNRHKTKINLIKRKICTSDKCFQDGETSISDLIPDKIKNKKFIKNLTSDAFTSSSGQLSSSSASSHKSRRKNRLSKRYRKSSSSDHSYSYSDSTVTSNSYKASTTKHKNRRHNSNPKRYKYEYTKKKESYKRNYTNDYYSRSKKVDKKADNTSSSSDNNRWASSTENLQNTKLHSKRVENSNSSVSNDEKNKYTHSHRSRRATSSVSISSHDSSKKVNSRRYSHSSKQHDCHYRNNSKKNTRYSNYYGSYEKEVFIISELVNYHYRDLENHLYSKLSKYLSKQDFTIYGHSDRRSVHIKCYTDEISKMKNALIYKKIFNERVLFTHQPYNSKYLYEKERHHTQDYRKIVPVTEYHSRASKTIYIGNISKNSNFQDLRTLCETFGEVVDFHIKQKMVAYVFVQFTEITTAVNAINKLNGTMFDTNRLTVSFAKSTESVCIWLGNLPTSTKESDFPSNVLSCCYHVLIDNVSFKSLLFYHNLDDAANAIGCLVGTTIRSHKIHVDYASSECQLSFLSKMKRNGEIKYSESTSSKLNLILNLKTRVKSPVKHKYPLNVSERKKRTCRSSESTRSTMKNSDIEEYENNEKFTLKDFCKKIKMRKIEASPNNDIIDLKKMGSELSSPITNTCKNTDSENMKPLTDVESTSSKPNKEKTEVDILEQKKVDILKELSMLETKDVEPVKPKSKEISKSSDNDVKYKMNDKILQSNLDVSSVETLSQCQNDLASNEKECTVKPKNAVSEDDCINKFNFHEKIDQFDKAITALNNENCDKNTCRVMNTNIDKLTQTFNERFSIFNDQRVKINSFLHDINNNEFKYNGANKNKYKLGLQNCNNANDLKNLLNSFRSEKRGSENFKYVGLNGKILKGDEKIMNRHNVIVDGLCFTVHSLYKKLEYIDIFSGVRDKYLKEFDPRYKEIIHSLKEEKIIIDKEYAVSTAEKFQSTCKPRANENINYDDSNDSDDKIPQNSDANKAFKSKFDEKLNSKYNKFNNNNANHDVKHGKFTCMYDSIKRRSVKSNQKDYKFEKSLDKLKNLREQNKKMKDINVSDGSDSTLENVCNNRFDIEKENFQTELNNQEQSLVSVCEEHSEPETISNCTDLNSDSSFKRIKSPIYDRKLLTLPLNSSILENIDDFSEVTSIIAEENPKSLPLTNSNSNILVEDCTPIIYLKQIVTQIDTIKLTPDGKNKFKDNKKNQITSKNTNDEENDSGVLILNNSNTLSSNSSTINFTNVVKYNHLIHNTKLTESLNTNIQVSLSSREQRERSKSCDLLESEKFNSFIFSQLSTSKSLTDLIGVDQTKFIKPFNNKVDFNTKDQNCDSEYFNYNNMPDFLKWNLTESQSKNTHYLQKLNETAKSIISDDTIPMYGRLCTCNLSNVFNEITEKTFCEQVFKINKIISPYQFVWKGIFQLKSWLFVFQMHYISGNTNILKKFLPKLKEDETENKIFKITQRMKLNNDQYHSIEAKLKDENEYTMLLAMPSGKNIRQVALQNMHIKQHLTSYLSSKNSAGLVTLNLENNVELYMFPQTNQINETLTKYFNKCDLLDPFSYHLILIVKSS